MQVDDIGYQVSEDCLTLDIIRPSGHQNNSLPVLVWIHGGGYVMGGSADERYNLTFIVQDSVLLGKPIIAVSIQFKVSPDEIRSLQADLSHRPSLRFWLFGGFPSSERWAL